MTPLYLITDRTQTAGRTLPAVVADALSGGVGMVQLREKDLCSRDLFELAKNLRELTRSFKASFIINDRTDIAQAVGAEGVQLGIGSIPVEKARTILGSRALIGYSAHSVAEALQAQAGGASFVTFGPVFDTASKRMYGSPLGLNKLAEAVSKLSIPVYGLGGIQKQNIYQVISTGCKGVALISAIISASNPQLAASELNDAIAETMKA